ncbi:MAG TPA: methylmalonyl Co-A mutase-associated GTPase MeaB, partial [Ferruginibacter sp.]|nr:methylmalonyl Co-A mutase-associated GTPase MeaB [Ferruginibacter sp.]
NRDKNKRHEAEEYVQGILNSERVMLSKAITLVESRLNSDNELAEQVLEKLLPHTGNSIRIGITGVPGAGKSTLIENFGGYLTAAGKKVAVLTIDPSSQKTKGSILGDKTRMESLANDPRAFVRPSASGATLGGVHSRTRETILLCEAGGFDVIIVETVGVGQSEISVKGIVDFFLLIMLSGAGDELQGIKRGIMEMADLIAINKADGDNIKRSEMAMRQYQNALHMFPPNENSWYPKVITCSAINNDGIKEIWEIICEYETKMKETTFFSNNMQHQNLQWMHDVIKYQLQNSFYNHSPVKNTIGYLQKAVEEKKLPAIVAAKELLNLFFQTRKG